MLDSHTPVETQNQMRPESSVSTVVPLLKLLSHASKSKAVKTLMNWADWAIFAILAVSSLISLKRGFVKEALSMANWVLAFVIAMTFRDALSVLLEPQIATPSLRDMVAFGLLFAATLIIGAMVNYLIGELVRMTGLSGTDRLFGMIFGFIRGFIIVMAALLLLPSLVSIDQDTWWKESLVIPHLLEFEDWCRLAAKEFISFATTLFS